MRKCDRRRPLCLAVGTTAPYLQEQLPGPFGYLLVAPASLGGIALGRSQDREEGQGPHPRSPRDWHQQHHAHPPQSATLHEGFMGGTDRVPVDTLGSNLLAPTSLQRLVYAEDEWPFPNERLYERSQQDATHVSTRPASAAQDPMVAMEALVLIQTHRPQGRAHRSPTRSEDRTHQEHLGILPDAP